MHTDTYQDNHSQRGALRFPVAQNVARNATMTSREIAELVNSRQDSVRRTIERLAERGVIALPPMVEKPTAGRPAMVCEWIAPAVARGRRLTRGRRSPILPSAGAKSPAGIGVPQPPRPHRPLDRGFFVRVVQHPSYGRLDGGLFGGAGALGGRYANAVQSPTLIGVGAGGVDLYPGSLIMAGTLSHAAYCGTPEELFTIRPEAEAGLPIDALLCALSRARAVLAIASGQFNDPAAPRWTDSIISSALWAVEGDLSLIEQMVRYGWETEEASHG